MLFRLCDLRNVAHDLTDLTMWFVGRRNGQAACVCVCVSAQTSELCEFSLFVLSLRHSVTPFLRLYYGCIATPPAAWPRDIRARGVCVRACVRVCLCMRACVRACVRVCACRLYYLRRHGAGGSVARC